MFAAAKAGPGPRPGVWTSIRPSVPTDSLLGQKISTKYIKFFSDFLFIYFYETYNPVIFSFKTEQI